MLQTVIPAFLLSFWSFVASLCFRQTKEDKKTLNEHMKLVLIVFLSIPSLAFNSATDRGKQHSSVLTYCNAHVSEQTNE